MGRGKEPVKRPGRSTEGRDRAGQAAARQEFLCRAKGAFEGFSSGRGKCSNLHVVQRWRAIKATAALRATSHTGRHQVIGVVGEGAGCGLGGESQITPDWKGPVKRRGWGGGGDGF